MPVRHSLVLAALGVLAASSLVPTAAQASEAGQSAVIEVCPNNSLDTSGGGGMVQEEIALALLQIQDMCDAGVGTSITFEKYIELGRSGAAYEYANVVAQIRTRPGAMSIMAYANAIPRDGRVKELSCIYRAQPFTGPSVAWSGCGTARTTSDSSMTTRSNEFCPPKGTRFEALASLYVNGSLRQQDSEVAVAL